jgi:hypothetical protein
MSSVGIDGQSERPQESLNRPCRAFVPVPARRTNGVSATAKPPPSPASPGSKPLTSMPRPRPAIGMIASNYGTMRRGSDLRPACVALSPLNRHPQAAVSQS